MTARTQSRRWPALVGASVLTLVLAGLASGAADARTTRVGASARSASAAPTPAPGPGPGPGRSPAQEAAGNYDARSSASPALQRRAAVVQRSRGPAAARLARSVGGDASVSLDPVTGTPREVSSRLGFLTPASTASASTIA